MTTYELLMLFMGFTIGTVAAVIYFYFPIKKLKEQVWKLKGQVYYWSRQMPVKKKRRRPKKVKSAHNA